jgi:alpha-L-rhamnosidase
MIKVNSLLGYGTEEYEAVLENTIDFFRREYMQNGRMKQKTQTAAVLAIIFGLSDNPAETCAQLAENVREHKRLTTGFIGSTYLLDALTAAGEDALAVDLLLRKEYPSWLYPVTMGATTIWERWNGIFPDGRFADAGMNSFNHYAYGSVFSWIFRRLAGISPTEDEPGYKKVVFAPYPDSRIPQVTASLETAYGEIKSSYEKTADGWSFTFTVPGGCSAEALLFGKSYALKTGENTILSKS